jgi:hypothetical protein
MLDIENISTRNELLLALSEGITCGLTRDDILDDPDLADVWIDFNRRERVHWNKLWRKANR